MIPGELFVADGEIEINAGRRTLDVQVENTGDRPVQVGSHYHFYEVNTSLRVHVLREASLSYRRDATRGFRLDIPAGTAVRFEPGQSRQVRLVEYAGARRVFGFQGKVMGDL